MRNFESIPAAELALTQVRYTKERAIATITIDRASASNAYSTSMLRGLARTFEDASWDDSVAVIVFTGAGDKAFCTGGDVKEYESAYTRRPRDYWKYMGLFRAYIESILHCGKPVIARINGMAVGGGNESQLACDLAVIAEHAWLGQVGTNVGSVACGGATQWLPLVVGDRRAREMLMLNARIGAHKALEWGLVNAVVPSVTKDGKFIEHASDEEINSALERRPGYAIDLSRLDAKVAEYAAMLKDKFPECLRYTKAQTNHLKEAVWHSTVAHAQDWLSIHFASPEPREGMRAFVQKRRPDYAGVRERWAADGSPEFAWGPGTSSCSRCGANDLPAAFRYCGSCGHEITR